jgi:hypothetical protein
MRRAALGLIGVHGREGEPRVVIDRHMQELGADALDAIPAVTGDPVRRPLDTHQALDIKMQHALVSFLPSIDGKGHALLMEGQNMAGTQAAGDFVLDQSAMNPFLTKARLPDGSVGPFKVLLQTRTVGANAPGAQVVVERFGFVRTAE